MRVKKSQNEILEPVGASRGPQIDSMVWLQDVSHAGTLVRAKLYIRPIDYIIRENGKSYGPVLPTGDHNITSVLQRLDIQRELRWTPETCEGGEVAEEDCLYTQRELRWSPEGSRGEKLRERSEALSGLSSSTFFSALFLKEWLRKMEAENFNSRQAGTLKCC